MGLFDSIGQFLGITSSYKAKAPEFINQQYLSGLENTARAIESRPDTTSFADALLQQAQQQQMQQANALAGSARGNVNPALLQRNVMRQQSEAAQGAANQASVVRAQEALQNRSLNDQLALQYRQLGLGAAGQQANLGLQAQGINAGIDQSNTRNTAGLFGGLINAAGGILSRPSATQSKPVYAEGGFVDGVPNVPGDSELNDTVDIKASPGEIIVPRSYAQNADMAKEFIDHIMASKQKAPVSYADILKAKKKVDSYAQGGEVMSDAEVEAEMRQKALEKNYGLDPVAAFKARFEPPQLYKKPESISDEQLADLRQAGQSELVSGAMGGTNLPMPMAIGAIRKTPTGKLLGTVAEEIPRVGATEQNVVVNNLAEQAVREGLFEGKQEAKKAAIGNKVVPPKVGEGKLTAIGGVGNLDQPMAKEVSQTTDKFYDTKYKVNPRWVVEKLDDGKHWVYDRLKEEKNIGFDFQRDAEKLATEWNNEKDYYRRSAPKPKDTFSYNVDTKREQEIIENIKNGFGDKFPEKEFKVAEATAKSKNSPYAPVLSKGTKGMRGEQTAYWPNFDAIPTGKIGDLGADEFS